MTKMLGLTTVDTINTEVAQSLHSQQAVDRVDTLISQSNNINLVYNLQEN